MDFAQRIANEIRFYRDEHDLKAQVILEELGMGVGVVETLEDMGFADQVWGVNTGASASEGGREIYTNLRCEMWGELRTGSRAMSSFRTIPNCWTTSRSSSASRTRTASCGSRRRTRCGAAAFARLTLATRSR
jgi:hypothetical protein